MRNKILPGMLCNAVEFFTDGSQIRFINNGQIKAFSQLDYTTARIIGEKIASNPEIENQLRLMHPDSEIKRLEQYIVCNFSGLDSIGDITNGKLQEGEFWDCPKRGNCSGEGIICKAPRYNQELLTYREVSLIKLLVTDMTNEVIAESMVISLGTFHALKKVLYNKLNVSTKQQVTIIAMELNII